MYFLKNYQSSLSAYFLACHVGPVHVGDVTFSLHCMWKLQYLSGGWK